MTPGLVFTLTLALFFGIDYYVYQSVKRAYTNVWVRRIYWLICIVGYLYMLTSFLGFDRANESRKVVNGFATLIMIWYVPKFLIIAILLLEDFTRLLFGLYRRVAKPEVKELGESFVPGRRKFVQNVALGLASIPFLGVLHGIWKGKYNYRVIKETLFYDDLPEAFDGFTILQISDIHTGSFDDKEKIQYGVDLIKAQKADLILFTGDMVNNQSSECIPWLDVFKGIEAPHGQFCVLGNHDYGDYMTWDSEADKAADVEALVRMESEIGFRNLRNENVKIEKDGQSIDLVGVENWGLRFKQRGDLDLAMKDLEKDSFKILMSHDPTHFDEVVIHHEKKVHLTLSGHTHGWQFGIEIPGFVKWSPSSFAYPKWAGLYQEKGRKLYVNRGFGYLAFPGRVGIWPEITLLELRRKA
ncbi:metallophosphoesterase [Phaeocystidibacter marisrubri]|uniref:Metallophosphoesterase n=1 Tax=Phaeocystidibacter marisrubri TaxID=1577780 RepID=A0A6L3ZC40_9FLAO|nr:metallophosphoesterase [Phaeocystidibacter marisrubri]KAB2815202.1 metallophosphoesterase [Phaeocystidibacter marisrubri]GGH70866.1 phosphoesterase [Phaeocystidibacter marisrubri]